MFPFDDVIMRQAGAGMHRSTHTPTISSDDIPFSLWWRHNGCDSVSNHQPRECLLRRLIRRTSKKTSKLRVTGLCAGNSPETGEFPAQMASNAENVSIWWRHHEVYLKAIANHNIKMLSLLINLGNSRKKKLPSTKMLSKISSDIYSSKCSWYALLFQKSVLHMYLGYSHDFPKTLVGDLKYWLATHHKHVTQNHI